MKVSDLVGQKLSGSLLGGDPSKFDVIKDGNSYLAFDKKSESEEPVARMTVENCVIIDLVIEEEVNKSDAATALIKQLCKDADRANLSIVIHSESLIGGIKAVRFMESFGFMKNRDDFLTRRPGAILPYSVIW